MKGCAWKVGVWADALLSVCLSAASKESFAAPKKSVAAHKRPVAASKELPTEPQLAEGPAAPIPEDFGMSADDEDFVMARPQPPSPRAVP